MSSMRLKPLAIVTSLSLIWPAALAQNAAPGSSGSAPGTAYKFSKASGEELYANVCQGCHMPDGKGATGAGAYPPLAGGKTLERSRCAVHVVVNGQRAMPPFGDMMSDDQVAAVVNYVRTHFGNNYRDTVTAADVKAVRR
jgi:mono/diheme cytochrome c family protein